MLIIADHRLPFEAKEQLSRYGELVEFSTDGIVYEAINGHPDIFMCQVPGNLIVAPNLPGKYLSVIAKNHIHFQPGELTLGNAYPQTAYYNAVSIGKVFIHNLDLTDHILLSAVKDSVKLNCKQGYTRCNLLALGDAGFLTSDPSIHKVLVKNHFDCLLVNPGEIQLPGFEHGFFGGVCGIWQKRVFISGNLDYMADGSLVRSYIESKGYEIVELFDGPLFDGGGIFFLEGRG